MLTTWTPIWAPRVEFVVINHCQEEFQIAPCNHHCVAKLKTTNLGVRSSNLSSGAPFHQIDPPTLFDTLGESSADLILDCAGFSVGVGHSALLGDKIAPKAECPVAIPLFKRGDSRCARVNTRRSKPSCTRPARVRRSSHCPVPQRGPPVPPPTRRSRRPPARVGAD